VDAGQVGVADRLRLVRLEVARPATRSRKSRYLRARKPASGRQRQEVTVGMETPASAHCAERLPEAEASPRQPFLGIPY
jgi:hypothetical protein